MSFLIEHTCLGFCWWDLIALIILIAVVVLFIVVRRNMKKEENELEDMLSAHYANNIEDETLKKS